MSDALLLNVRPSEKAASIRKRRKDELEKYRKPVPDSSYGPNPKEDEFSLPDEDRLLTKLPQAICHQRLGAQKWICGCTLSLRRYRGTYSIICPDCLHEVIQAQPTSQAAIAAWRVYRAMCK